MPRRVLALMNQKGGVGKTTTCANLGAALAEQGRRVALVDVDPQAHLTLNYGVEVSTDAPTLYDVIAGDALFDDALIEVSERVAVLPGSIDLAGAELELADRPGRETVFRRKLDASARAFDDVLLDCPPSLGLLTLNALAAADEVLVPMQAHFLALQGMAKLFETVRLVAAKINPRLRVAGVCLTMFDSNTKLGNEVVAELQGFLDGARGKGLPWSDAQLFRTRVRRNIKLAESPSFGQTILQYDGASNGAADYRALARELTGLPPTEEKPTVVKAKPRVEVTINPGVFADAEERAIQ